MNDTLALFMPLFINAAIIVCIVLCVRHFARKRRNEEAKKINAELEALKQEVEALKKQQ